MVADLNPVGQFRLRVMICEPIAAESSYFHHGIAHDLFKLSTRGTTISHL